MIDHSNYARNIELKRFSAIHENIIQEEETSDKKTHSYADVMDGKPWEGKTGYEATWEGIIKIITAKVDTKVYEGVIKFQPPITMSIKWKVDPANGNVSYEDGAESGLAEDGDYVRKMLIAMAGQGTDEGTLYDIFRDMVQSQPDYDDLSARFANLRIPYDTDQFSATNDPYEDDSKWERLKVETPTRKYDYPSPDYDEKCSLEYWLGQELDDGEVRKINDYMSSKNIPQRIKAL